MCLLRPGKHFAHIATLIFAIIFSSPAQAGFFIWQNTCTSDNWFACCDSAGNNYNNWFTTPVPGCPSSAFPSDVDDVALLTNSVYLTGLSYVYSFDSDGT